MPSWRAVQIETSRWPSSVPPNHAASSPSLVSTIVDAWADANGARSNTNPEDTMPEATAGGGSAAGVASAHANATRRWRLALNDRRVPPRRLSLNG